MCVLCVVEDSINQGELARGFSTVDLLRGEVVRISKSRRHVIRAPDNNDMDERQPDQCTENRTERQIISQDKCFPTNFPHHQAYRDQPDRTPGENP